MASIAPGSTVLCDASSVIARCGTKCIFLWLQHRRGAIPRASFLDPGAECEDAYCLGCVALQPDRHPFLSFVLFSAGPFHVELKKTQTDRSMSPEEPTRLLSASVIEEDHTALERILCGSQWQVVGASTTEDAEALLLANKMPLVICAAPLVDSDWKSWVRQACQRPEAPKLIMSARVPGERFWTEALGLSCYDVLPWPYVASEVL